MDQLFHRGIVSSNYAESTFSYLKNLCLNKVHPITSVIEKLVSMNTNWMYVSMWEKIEAIPVDFENIIPNN